MISHIRPLQLIGAIAAIIFAAGVCNSFGDQLIGQIVKDPPGFGYTSAPPPSFRYFVFQFDSVSQPRVTLRPSLFEDIRVSAATAGQEFFVGPNTDPDFALVAAQLTNGIDEKIFIWDFAGPGMTVGSASAAEGRESELLGSAGHPDLMGRKITSISMFINSYTSNSLFSYVDFTIRIYGVPEPATAPL